MFDTVIKVENLSKQYRIGTKEGYRTFRETLVDAAKAPFSRLGSLLPTLRSKLSSPSSKPASRDDTFWALKDVSFEVKQGEVVGIIGRNGAGKSTLLKILSKITEPTTGRVELRGRVGSLLEVGTGFHPELTGHENVYLYGAILGMDRWEVTRKFDEIVAFAEVEKFIETPVKRYSSGMYMRLAFAVAAFMETEILLVDEVLAVGDAAFQKKCTGKMGDVAKQGRTVLFVSHNMIAIEALCSRGVVLNAGRIVYDGKAEDAIQKYNKSMQINTDISLKERIDRVGNGKVRAIDLKIYNQDEILTNQIGLGETFRVELRTIGVTKKAIIGLHFGNMFRHSMIRGYTYEQVAEDIELKGEDTISCTFYDFPMMHGVYDVHVWIGTYPPVECMDYVEHASALEIIPKDVFNSGRILDPHGGVAFCKTTWKINQYEYRTKAE
jgi:lipopolysaccharide transport system ATP-binding protein